MPHTIGWIDLDGTANMRDVGGIPTTDGTSIAPRVLLRSDNLQDLSRTDLDILRRLGLTDVVDLRSAVEVASTGPGPLHAQSWVRIHHHSFLPEGPTPAAPDPTLDPRALPWVGLRPSTTHHLPAVAPYLSYLSDRGDSVVAALQAIAHGEGATLVHCAAGKDRTGTVVALALVIAGADPEAIVADYAASAERIERILERLLATPTYGAALAGRPVSAHTTHPQTMAAVLERVAPGGDVTPLLDQLGPHGWTEADTHALRTRLRASST